jgi:hypothetical protein
VLFRRESFQCESLGCVAAAATVHNERARLSAFVFTRGPVGGEAATEIVSVRDRGWHRSPLRSSLKERLASISVEPIERRRRPAEV